jgi:ABC-type nickel/cobalt efflux system permease component RcnA
VLESGSYGLVALLGLALCWRSGRRLLPRRAQAETQAHDHHHHGASCGCGHGHGPDAASLALPSTTSQTVMTVLSIGLRPCSGAILVLLIAVSSGQLAAGVLAVLAMAAGTALTVSVLAVLAVHARRHALALAAAMGRHDAGIARLADGLGLIGGLILIALGSSLLLAGWQIAKHPLL